MAGPFLVPMALLLGRRSGASTDYTMRVSFVRGFLTGGLIAVLQMALGHAWIDYRGVSFHGNAGFALAVPGLLLPLAITRGWTWVSDRWSGRSGPRLLLYTVGLVLAAASAFPLDYVLFTPASDVALATAVDQTLLGLIFVLPVVALAAVLYWAFTSGKASTSFGILALSYLGGLALALVLPTLTMGAVAGTAAGHSWQRPGARGRIALLVVLMMVVGVFELPMAAASALPYAIALR